MGIGSIANNIFGGGEATKKFKPSGIDAGVSIRAAELQSQLVEPLNPIALLSNPTGVLKSFLSGLGGLSRNYIVGSVLMKPAIRKAIIGGGQRPLDLTTFRLMSIISSQALLDARAQKQLNKEKEKRAK